MLISIPSKYKSSIKDVSPQHWRLQAAILSTSSTDILIISSYFPVDKRTFDFDEQELQEILIEIETIIQQNNFDHLVWAGDINADFLRVTGHVNIISEFVSKLDMEKSWDIYDIDFTCCHEVNNAPSFSIIDHFFWNKSLTPFIEDAGVKHLSENPSDHEPIYCVINVGNIPQTSEEASKAKSRPSWKHATSVDRSECYNTLLRKLKNIETPNCVAECCDVTCKNKNHNNTCDDYLKDILDAMEESCECLPAIGNNAKKKKNSNIIG